MASFGNVVLSYGDSLLRESEMTILKKDQWLNDVIIAFYFEYLENQQREDDACVMLYHPGLSQFLKMTTDSSEIPILLGGPPASSIQYAFWAVNDSKETTSGGSGSHWSLLVFSRPDNAFLHFDSWCGSPNDFESREISRKLSPHFSPTSIYKNVENCIPQANGRDCGLHVIVNAKSILDFIRSKANVCSRTPLLLTKELQTASPEHALKMRKDLIALIKQLSEKNAASK